jgi:hypothetical protein
MKNLITFALLAFAMFSITSCQKDELVDLSQKNVIFTDNPPVELQNVDTDYEVSVYFEMKDYEAMDLHSAIPCDYWNFDQFGNQYVRTINKYKIRGRTNFGFYHGNLYVAKSYTELAVDLDMLKLITADISKYDYALGRRTIDTSTKYGLTIYQVYHE